MKNVVNDLDFFSNEIELWRFLFTVLVIVMHAGIFNGAYIAVEFFFMLSGFLWMHAAETKEGHIKIGAARLFGPYWVALALNFLWLLSKGALQGFFPLGTFTILLETIGLQTLVEVKTWGSQLSIFNGVTWYVSALLIGKWLMGVLLRLNQKIFLKLIIPCAVAIGFAYFNQEYGHLDFGMIWMPFNGFQHFGVNLGLVRGITELCAGAGLYMGYKKIKGITVSKSVHHTLGALELLLVITSVTLILKYRSTAIDFVQVILLALIILLAFYQKGFLKDITANKLVRFLGRFSYALYLGQLFGFKLYNDVWMSTIGERYSIIGQIMCSLSAALIVHFVGNWLSAQIQKIIDRYKNTPERESGLECMSH